MLFLFTQWLHRHHQKLVFFLPAVLVLISNLTFFNRYFPLSEGWWETYGYLVNLGLMPYKNFSLEFTPLFVFFNAFLLKLTSSFFVLRIWGVALIVVNVILLQILLEKFLSRVATTIGVTLAIFLFMSDSVYIAKDYQAYQMLATVLTLLIGVKLQQTVLNKPLKANAWYLKILILAGVLGMFIGLVSMIKQNIGAFLLLAYVISMALSARRSDFKTLIISAAGLLLGVVAVWAFLIEFSIEKGVASHDFYNLFFKNDSKGSMFVILARVFLDPLNRKIMILSLVISFMAWLGIKKIPMINQGKVSVILQKSWFYSTGLVLFVIGLIYLIHKNILPLVTIPLAVIWYVSYTTFFIKKNTAYKKSLEFLLMPLLALIYCNTQSSSFNYTGLIFVNAFSFAYLAQQISVHYQGRLALVYGFKIKSLHIYIGLIAFSLWVTINKWESPYNWWGLKQDGIFKAVYKLNYPETEGIYVDKTTQQAFEVISQNIRAYSHSDSDVYLFPDIPIFYLLEKKKPPFHNVVEWFDVLSSSNGEKEFQQFKNNLPNVIIYLDPPDMVYAGHAGLIKRPLIQMQFKRLLNDLTNSGQYICKTYLYDQNLDKIYFGSSGEAKERVFIIQNPSFINKPLSFLIRKLSEKTQDFVVTDIYPEHVHFQNDHVDQKLQQIVNVGERLSIQLMDVDLKKTSDFLGKESSGQYYMIHVYVKSTEFNRYPT